eukprot:m.339711 g.339711  ORF g.339711 m.339711 type:complete len:433 (-) comp55752_c0_seq9:1019-2317(-)
MSCTAAYSYTAANTRELSVKRAERLTIVDAPPNKQWWKVKNEAGNVGFVPANYLKLENKKPAPDPLPVLPPKPSALAAAAVVAPPAMNVSASREAYCDVVLQSPGATGPAPSTETKRVRVIHVYSSQLADELSIKPGDEITIIDEKTDGWAKGVIRSTAKTGWFPLSFTEEMPPDSAVAPQPTATASAAAAEAQQAPPAKPAAKPETPKQIVDAPVIKDASFTYADSADSAIVCCCTALYKYQATQDSELSLEAGDVIWILEKTNDIWWRSRNYYGIVGFAPVSYLQEETDSQPTSVKADVGTIAPALSMRVQSQPQHQAPPSAAGVAVNLQTMSWYHPTLTREHSESALMSKGSQGTFLVRSSASHNTLSVNVGRHVEHFKITQDKKWNVYEFGDRRFESIPAIVTFYETNAIYTLADKTIITLKAPYANK